MILKSLNHLKSTTTFRPKQSVNAGGRVFTLTNGTVCFTKIFNSEEEGGIVVRNVLGLDNLGDDVVVVCKGGNKLLKTAFSADKFKIVRLS